MSLEWARGPNTPLMAGEHSNIMPICRIIVCLCALLGGCGRTPVTTSPPRAWDGSGLSFDLRTEFQEGRAKIVGESGFVGKTEWGQIQGLLTGLVAKRASRADRERLVEIINSAAGRDVDPADELLSDIRPHLVHALALHGEIEQVISLLSVSPPFGGISGPLVGELHDLKLAKTLPEGLGVLFQAYDVATPEAQARIREVLEYDFEFTRQQLKETTDVVEWCREWYAKNSVGVISNYQTYISGGDDGNTAHVLMPIEDWFLRELKQMSSHDLGREPPYTFRVDDWLLESLTVDGPTWVAEQQAWVYRFSERGPLEWSAVVVVAAGGRQNQFKLDGVVCDMKVTWAGSIAEDGVTRLGSRTATVPMRFGFSWSCCPIFIGEDWNAIELPASERSPQSVFVKYIEPHRETAESVATEVAKLATELWPDEADSARVVKVYPDGPSLQLFVSPNAPFDLLAYSVPGTSLKIVANRDTPVAAIAERLRKAAKMRAEPVKTGQPEPSQEP